jgi:hypothetical protein
MMRQIDMSAEAVSSRLKLVSQLRRLCLSLGTSQIQSKAVTRYEDAKNKSKQARATPRQRLR